MTGFHVRPALLASAMMASLALVAPAAEAAPIVSHSITVSAAVPNGYVGTMATADLTDFDTTILIPRINPARGAQITSITIDLTGGVFGDFFATNPTTNRTYNNQTATVSATITVGSPDPSGTPLGIVVPLVSETFTLKPKQTVSRENIAGFATTSRTTDASNPHFSAIASMFLGSGMLALPVSAEGTSNFSGSGNVRFGANTLAGATATLTINYINNATVPAIVAEPAGLALFGCGLLGLVTLRRKRT